MTTKVQGDEVLWAIHVLEPVTTRELADVLPISYPAVLHRCRRFTSQGYLDSNEETKPYTWRLSSIGEDRLADTDLELPAPESASVREYFMKSERERSYRSMTREAMLATVANLDGKWHSTTAITEEVEVAQQTVRKYLHQLEEQELVVVDDSGTAYEWCVTDLGRDQVAELGGDVVVEDGSYGLVTPIELVDVVAGLPGEWQTTTTVVEELAVARDTVLGHLHESVDRGWVAVDESARPYRWCVTEAGYEQLTGSDETVAGEKPTCS